jgi:KaiC/GvpD/RAD55 family RecA-like ATPase
MNLYVLVHDKQKIKGALTYSSKDEKLFKQKNEEGWGVYFAVNQFKKDRREEQLIALRYAYADFDVAKKGDGQTREQKEEKKYNLLYELLNYCPPTMVIDTSNGIQPLWELKDKSVSDENKKRYKNILKGIVEWSKKYGSAGDNVYDVSRILRLPDYYHQKEESYLCKVLEKNDVKYSYEELEAKFPYKSEEKVYTPSVNTNLGLIDREIFNIDFKELIMRAFQSIGRPVSFDNMGRMIDPIGGTTGTFIGRRDNKDYLCSSSHEPYKGNRITAVADILQITNKEARKWIIDEYKLNYSELANKSRVEEKVKEIQKPKEIDLSNKRYTWGTRYLDTNFAIIKPGNFIVCGATRNSGKTTYTFFMAKKNAELGHKVLYISLEMDTDMILDDISRKYAGITIEEEFDIKIPETKMKAYNRKKEEIKSIKNLELIGIRQAEDVSWEIIKEVIAKYENVDMVFIDNLDMIANLPRETDIDRQKRIVKCIMSFTSENKIPIILIHHYRKRTGKDYGMDELGGSGKIADGADRIIKIGKNQDPEATYPEKYKSTIHLQKGRGYPEHITNIYFIKGEFVDTPPEEGISLDELYFNQ